MTKQRLAVLEAVQRMGNHPTAEEICCEVRKVLPGVAVATVYNNLNALTGLGLVRRVRTSGQPDRYDRNLSPHDHLICDRCGAFSDISLGDLQSELEARAGFPLNFYELSLHYLCPACRSGKPEQR